MPKKRTKKNKLKGGAGKGTKKRSGSSKGSAGKATKRRSGSAGSVTNNRSTSGKGSAGSAANNRSTSAKGKAGKGTKKRSGSSKGSAGKATKRRSGSAKRSGSAGNRSGSAKRSGSAGNRSGSATTPKKKKYETKCRYCGEKHAAFTCPNRYTLVKLNKIILKYDLKKVDYTYTDELVYRCVTLKGVDSNSEGEIFSSAIPNENIDYLVTTGLNGCLGVVFVLPDAVSFVHIQSDLLKGLSESDKKSKIEEKFELLRSEIYKQSDIKEIQSLLDFYNYEQGEIFLITVEQVDPLYKDVLTYFNNIDDTVKCKIYYSFSSNFGYNISTTPKLPNKIFYFGKQPPSIIDSINTYPLGF